MYFINSTRGNNIMTVDSVLYTIPDGSYTCADLIDQLNLNSSRLGRT